MKHLSFSEYVPEYLQSFFWELQYSKGVVMKGQRSSETKALAASWQRRRTEQYVEEANPEDTLKNCL